MADLDFPLNPTVSQTYLAPNGVTYTWDGSVWTVPSGGAGGGGPTGPAGGDLAGSTYPNPVLHNEAVTPEKIQDGAINHDKLAPGAVNFPSIGNGEVGRIKLSADVWPNPIPVGADVGRVLTVNAGPVLKWVAPPLPAALSVTTGMLQVGATTPATQSQWATSSPPIAISVAPETVRATATITTRGGKVLVFATMPGDIAANAGPASATVTLHVRRGGLGGTSLRDCTAKFGVGTGAVNTTMPFCLDGNCIDAPPAGTYDYVITSYYIAITGTTFPEIQGYGIAVVELA